MKSTFKPGDKLFLKKVQFLHIHEGDVIVFKGRGEDGAETITHRVVGLHSDSLITRGDNNLKKDAHAITEETLLGRIDHFERKGKLHKVAYGVRGMLHAKTIRITHFLVRTLKLLNRKPYRLLRSSGLVTMFWRPDIERIDFMTQKGPMQKYIHAGKSIATYWNDRNRWQIRRPYELVIGLQPRKKKKQ